MSDNSKLLKEIYKEKEMINRCLLSSSFKNKRDEEECSQFKEDSLKRTRLYAGLIVIVFSISHTLFFYIEKKELYALILHIIINCINLTFIVLIHKTRINSTFNNTLCNIRFICNLVNYAHYMIYIGYNINNYDNKEIKTNHDINQHIDLMQSGPRNFYLTGTITIIEYCLCVEMCNFLDYFICLLYLGFAIFCNCNYTTNRVHMIPEIIASFGLKLIFNAIYSIWSFKREMFVNMKQTQTLSKYYESLVNNMQLQVVSFFEDKYLMFNSAYLSQLNIDNLNIENHADVRKDTYCSVNEQNKIKQSNLNVNQEIEDEVKINDDKINEISKIYFKNLVKTSDSESSLELVLNSIKESMLTNQGEYNGNLTFKALGTFTLKNKQFFSIYYRIFFIDLSNTSKYIIDVYINEITEIKQAENLFSETKIKQKLFSKFAHEFKTPMIIIKSLVNDINQKLLDKERCSDHEINELSDYIIYLSDYIQFLINDIIYYSNDKALTISISLININEIMDFCFGVSKSLLSVMPGRKSNIKTILMLESNLKYFDISSDKTRLKQIMLNLISNSVKFTKTGSITIGARLIREDKQDDLYAYLMEIFVKDTGVGFRDDELAKVRENSDNIIKINIENNNYNEMGSGIGITIIKNLVQKLGNRLDIESKYGEGSEFKIIIESIVPNDNWSVDSSNIKTVLNDAFETHSYKDMLKSSKDNVVIVDKVSEKELNNFKTAQRLSIIKFGSILEVTNFKEFKAKDKILVCDDSHTLRKAVTNLITNKTNMFNDFDVVECYDGVDMLNKIVEDQLNGNLIKIIITDENMEYMIGSDAIGIISEWERLNKIKKIFIVSLTAFIDENNINIIKSKGADIVFHKPLTVSILKDIFNSFKSKQNN